MDDIQFKIVYELPIEQVIELYREGGWWEETFKNRQTIHQMIKGSFCFMAAFYTGKCVGMGRVISDGISDGYIQDVIVLKEFRGLAIGKEIVRRLTQFCIERGLDWIGLIAEPDTASFYRNLGFQVLSGYQAMIFAIDKEKHLEEKERRCE